MACESIAKGECLGIACSELSAYIGSLEPLYSGADTELDNLESAIIEDCQAKAGCNAQQIREKGLDFATVSLNAGDLAAKVREQKVGGAK